MGSEWADSGTGSGSGTVYLAVGRETQEQKSVTGEVGKHRSGKNGNGMGSEWADSGTGSGSGTVYLAVGRETQEQKSVTGEVGKHRSGKKIS